MKRSLLIVCMLAATLAHGEPSKPALADLAWLAGCWEGGEGGEVIREQWMRPLGNAMIGAGHTARDGKTVAYEFMRIHQEADGIYFTANPSGQAQNSFKLVKWGPKEIVFEDPAHDFPQRVIYRLKDDGSLAPSIEGTVNGKLETIDYPMKRAACN